MPALMAQSASDMVLGWNFEDGVPGRPVNIATDTSGTSNHGRTRLGSPGFSGTVAGAEVCNPP